MKRRTPERAAERPRVLFVGQDVGGSNALRPVARALKRSADTRELFGNLDTPTPSIRKILRSWKPSLLVLGTSAGLSSDKIALREAKTLGIPAVSMVDYWANEHVRFSTPGTRDRAFFPDWVLVPDRACKRGLIRAGFNGRRVVVTGNPHFDQFFAVKKAVRRSTGPARISFLSQPFSELITRFPEMDLGYDERDVLRDVLVVIRALKSPPSVSVVFHPREKKRAKFNRIVKESGVRVTIEHGKRASDVFPRTDLAIGMNTMALAEAALSGIPAISYQPHLKKTDPFVPNRLKLTFPAYTKAALGKTLKRCLSAKKGAGFSGRGKGLADGQATRRVLAFLRLHWL